MPEGLLEIVRNYLDITWEDAEGDKKLTGIIHRGIDYLNWLAGANVDYMQAGRGQALLLDYCRYVRANALDDFQKNYLHELLAFQLSEGGNTSEENTDF